MKFLKIFERGKGDGFDYGRWIEAAELELATKQSALEAEYGLGHWPNWNSDLAKGKLSFSDEQGVQVIADVQIVGTFGRTDWLWAWANSHLPEPFVQDSFAAKDFGEKYRVAELSSPSVAADDLNILGWRLTAAAVRLADGIGAYRAPTGNGAVFLIIKSLARVPKH